MNFFIHQGDVLEKLREMPDESVNCCVTSPPYYGARDYQTGKWEGGSLECDHTYNHGVQGATGERASRTFTAQAVYKESCKRCGAIRIDQQIGLERTYPEYVSKMVEVFREVRRVLREDGTLWLNLGDCYATGAGAVGDHPGGGTQGERWAGYRGAHGDSPKHSDGAIGPMTQPNRMPQPGLKPKDLMMMPHRVAMALQDDGWWVRQDNVWVKGNGMPESVKDRTTRGHEYVFHLSKSEKYFYDADAISEPVASDTPKRYNRGRSDDHKYADGGPGHQTIARTFEGMAAKKQDGHGRRYAGFNEREFAGEGRDRRNKRSWWLVNTYPCGEAHFAVMPMEIAEIGVKAGCPEGGLVLDPFSGAGTTGLACLKNNRNYVGVELNSDYIQIAYDRANKYYPLLMQGIPTS